MGNEITSFTKNDLRLSSSKTYNNFVIAIYEYFVDLRINVDAYTKQIISFITEVAPIIVSVDVLNFILDAVSWFGGSQSEKEEVRKWAIKIISNL